jgi:hypothetical protein
MPVFVVHEREEGGHVLRLAPLADHDGDALGELFPGLFDARAFMVRGDPRREIGVQGFTRQERGVPVEVFLLEEEDLVQHLGDGEEHAGKIHHFGKAQDARVREEGGEVRRPEVRSGGLEVRRRNARWQVEVGVEGRPFGRIQHVADSLEPEDVCDFMRVGHDGRRAPGGRSRAEGPGAEERAFDVDVAVDEAGCEVRPSGVDDVCGGAVGAPAENESPADGEVDRVDAAGEDVHHAAVPDEKIGGALPRGGFDDVPKRDAVPFHGCFSTGV